MEEKQLQQEQMTEDVPEKKKGWKAVVAGFFIVILFLFIQAVVSVIGTSVATVLIMTKHDVSRMMPEELTNMVMESGCMSIILFAAILVTAVVAGIWYKTGYVKKYTIENRQELKEKAGNAKTIATLVLAGVGCYGVAILLATLISIISPAAMENFNNMMNTATDGNAIISFITVAVLAPVAEEILFRGIIFRKLLKTNTVTVAIAAQALLFAFYHFNIVQGIYVLPIALVLGYTAYRLNSVLPCMLIHAVNNLMPTIISALPETLQSVWVFAVVAVVCAAAIKMINKNEG